MRYAVALPTPVLGPREATVVRRCPPDHPVGRLRRRRHPVGDLRNGGGDGGVRPADRHARPRPRRRASAAARTRHLPGESAGRAPIGSNFTLTKGGGASLIFIRAICTPPSRPRPSDSRFDSTASSASPTAANARGPRAPRQVEASSRSDPSRSALAGCARPPDPTSTTSRSSEASACNRSRNSCRSAARALLAPLPVAKSFAPASSPRPSRARRYRLQQPEGRVATPVPDRATGHAQGAADAAAGRRGDRPGNPFLDASPGQDQCDLVDASRPKRRRGQRDRTVSSSMSGRARHQHELRARGRLLQRLQEGVLRRRHEQLGVVDDDHPAPPLERTVAHLLDRLPHLVDGDRPPSRRARGPARPDKHPSRCAGRRSTAPQPSTSRPEAPRRGVPQLRACAMAVATNRLPTPPGPVSSTLGGSESLAMAREMRDTIARWPTISSNGMALPAS